MTQVSWPPWHPQPRVLGRRPAGRGEKQRHQLVAYRLEIEFEMVAMKADLAISVAVMGGARFFFFLTHSKETMKKIRDNLIRMLSGRGDQENVDGT